MAVQHDCYFLIIISQLPITPVKRASLFLLWSSVPATPRSLQNLLQKIGPRTLGRLADSVLTLRFVVNLIPSSCVVLLMLELLSAQFSSTRCSGASVLHNSRQRSKVTLNTWHPAVASTLHPLVVLFVSYRFRDLRHNCSKFCRAHCVRLMKKKFRVFPSIH